MSSDGSEAEEPLECMAVGVRAEPDRSLDFPDEYRPLLAENVFLFDVDGRLVLTDPEVRRDHVLNATASYILSCCNGERSIRDIARSLVSRYDVDEPTAREDVRSLVRHLTTLRAIRVSTC